MFDEYFCFGYSLRLIRVGARYFDTESAPAFFTHSSRGVYHGSIALDLFRIQQIPGSLVSTLPTVPESGIQMQEAVPYYIPANLSGVNVLKNDTPVALYIPVFNVPSTISRGFYHSHVPLWAISEAIGTEMNLHMRSPVTIVYDDANASMLVGIDRLTTRSPDGVQHRVVSCETCE